MRGKRRPQPVPDFDYNQNNMPQMSMWYIVWRGSTIMLRQWTQIDTLDKDKVEILVYVDGCNVLLKELLYDFPDLTIEKIKYMHDFRESFT